MYAFWVVCDYAGATLKVFEWKQKRKAKKWLAAYNKKQDEGWGGFLVMQKHKVYC